MPLKRVFRLLVVLGALSLAVTSVALSVDGDPDAKTISLAYPTAAAPIPGGGFYIADAGNNRVLKVDGAGRATRVAGDGTSGSGGDGGPATQAQLNFPTDAVPTADGGILIASSALFGGPAPRIRKVAADGTISTVAGGAATVCPAATDVAGDGCPATQAILSNPTSAVPVAGGGFLISEYGNGDVRRVSAGGTITKIAGGVTNPALVCPAQAGTIGDGCPATQAILQSPTAAIPFDIEGAAVATPGTGYLITETQGCRVRFVSAGGVISTVAGLTNPNNTLTCRQPADVVPDSGTATALKLSLPTDARPTATAGVFLLADGFSCRVYRVNTNTDTYTTAINDTACAANIGHSGLTAAIPEAGGGYLGANSNSSLVDKSVTDGAFTVVAGGGSGTPPTGLPGGGAGTTTTPTVTTPAGGGTPAPTPAVTPLACTFTAKSGVVRLSTPKTKKGAKVRPEPKNTVAVTVRCSQVAKVKVGGAITAARNAKKGLKKARAFPFASTSLTLQAGVAAPVTLKVPAGALSYLKKGAKESAALTLTATTAAGGTGKASASIAKLSVKK
jgi:hypothetical protein